MLKRMMLGLAPIIAKRGIVVSCVLLLLVLALSLVACAGPTATTQPTPTPSPTPNPSGPIKATWTNPQVNGDTVSIPVSAVENNWDIHFKLAAEDGDIDFMAYIVDGRIHVRANVCPPCRSIGFSLQKDILVCDTCKTTFEAKTGEGIEGACVDFPKASVPYEINGGKIVMKDVDLIAAYKDTLKPGLP